MQKLIDAALKWLSVHEDGWKHIEPNQTKEAREIVQYMRDAVKAYAAQEDKRNAK